MKSKYNYFFGSLALCVLSLILLFLFYGPLSEYATNSELGFILMIASFLLSFLTICTTLHSSVLIFKKEKLYASWEEREKEAAFDIGFGLFRLRIFVIGFVLHFLLGAIIKQWIKGMPLQWWTVAYAISLCLLDILNVVQLIANSKKVKISKSAFIIEKSILAAGVLSGIIFYP